MALRSRGTCSKVIEAKRPSAPAAARTGASGWRPSPGSSRWPAAPATRCRGAPPGGSPRRPERPRGRRAAPGTRPRCWWPGRWPPTPPPPAPACRGRRAPPRWPPGRGCPGPPRRCAGREGCSLRHQDAPAVHAARREVAQDLDLLGGGQPQMAAAADAFGEAPHRHPLLVGPQVLVEGQQVGRDQRDDLPLAGLGAGDVGVDDPPLLLDDGVEAVLLGLGRLAARPAAPPPRPRPSPGCR